MILFSAILCALVDTVALGAAVVSAKVEPVTVVADTLVYNAAAYPVDDDADISDLLSKIPGLEINGSTITLYGRKVDRILMNGKEFFSDNTKAALKNMDANIVRAVKAYSRESDFTRLTGVDDGEEQNVLDICIKKHFMDGWNGSASGGYGLADTEESASSATPGKAVNASRYTGRFNTNKIKTDSQINLVAGVQNLPYSTSLSNIDRNVLGSGGAGDRTRWEAGASFSERRKTLEMSGSAHYEGNISDVCFDTRSQSILASGSSHSITDGTNSPVTHNLDANFKMEWRIDPKTTLIVEPRLRYNGRRSDGAQSFKTSYSADPDTLSAQMRDLARVSTTQSFSNRNDSRTRADLALQMTKRLKKRGRSITLRATGLYDYNASRSNDSLDIAYYSHQLTPKRYDRRSSDVYTNTVNGYVSGQLSYSEPIGRRWHLDCMYKAEYKPSSLDRDVTISSQHNDDMTSRGSLDYMVHNVSVAMRYATKIFNVSLGAKILPQTMDIRYNTDSGVSDNLHRTYFNAAPNLYLRYNHSEGSFLKFNYSSWTQSPSMYNLIPVTNGTNPMYVHEGNPDLRPSFVQRLNLEYNFSQKGTGQSLVLLLTGQMQQDKTVNSTIYIPETGARRYIPVNVDGNWFANFSTVYNKTFTDNAFSLNASLYCGYRNEMSYLYNNKLKEDELNRMGRFQGNLKVTGRYHSGMLDLSLFAGGQYTDERSFLRPELSEQPYRADAGVQAFVLLPWGMKIGADYTFMYQRGYSYSDLNRNYHILDASISQTLIKKKLFLRLSGTDLLNSGQNLVRSFSANNRSISLYNGPTRYALLKLVYKFTAKGK